MCLEQPNLYALHGSAIQVLDKPDRLDYFVVQSVELPRVVTPLEAWGMLMSQPMPFLKYAFQVRDFISQKFGVARIGGFSGHTTDHVEVGDKLDFFLVEHISNHCMVLTARDSHLDVATCISTEANVLSITSSVKTHNWFGKAYMVPVGFAHKIIVRAMLKRLKKGTLDLARP